MSFTGTVAKVLHILNINKGPWLGGDYLHQKAETLQYVLGAFNQDPSLYADIHEYVCWDKDLPEDANPKFTLDSWQDMDTFQHHGSVSVLLSDALCVL